MNKKDALWPRQFVELIKELAKAYDKFDISREIEYLDKAEALREDLNDRYEMSIDLLDYVNFGRAWLQKNDSPLKKD